ncbi:MAG: hypothetical protein MUE94_10620 [Verrucomicrobia bacterium]|jgi:hypothetical protein|nr:hypothetical protein [Verrucomicrobiota bacterium]
MNTHRLRTSHLVALLTALVLPARAQAAEKNVTETINLMRAAVGTEREAIVAETLQLTESEAMAFWPLYRSYRADLEKIGDGLVKLMLEYADVYPDVPENRARQMLKDLLDLEQRMVDKRAGYLKRAGKVLPASKVLRWAQIEHRLDLVLRLQLAGAVPMVPASSLKP